MRSAGRFLAVGVGIAATSYLAYIAQAFLRYGRGGYTSNTKSEDALLDRFMPTYEVMERHQADIRARAETMFSVAAA
jgi:hypothetical protein